LHFFHQSSIERSSKSWWRERTNREKRNTNSRRSWKNRRSATKLHYISGYWSYNCYYSNWDYV